jgi:transposase
LTLTQIRSVLKRAGRQRNLDKRAEQIQAGLRTHHLEAPGPVVAAFGATTKSTVEILTMVNRQIGELNAVMADHFEQHPDAAIYRSMPGIGTVLGARVLGEFGDDPDRYANVKSRRNYAATSPLTTASGKTKMVTTRWVRNDRLYDAMIRWAFCSISTSPGCRRYYQERRDAGDRHYKALRALANHLAGILHGCLQHHTVYDEDTAWGHRYPSQIDIAA